MVRLTVLLMTVSIILFSSGSGFTQTVHTVVSDGMSFRVDEVVKGQGTIWGLDFLSVDTLIFTEREGNIKTVSMATGKVITLHGVPEVWARDQGGMLDVAVPEYHTENGWIYFTYSKDVGGNGATTLARCRIDGDALKQWQELLVTESITETGRHFGSRITFDNDGHLFFSVGERGHRPNGQDTTTHAGSILRVNLDGSTPLDNPFSTQEGLPEIWSYGHRNPQGLFWDSSSGKLWANEHGPRGGDEINIIKRGMNYGWPVVSYGKEYWGVVAVGEATSKPGMVDPIKIYIPSIAPSSLLVYSGKAFPAWKGNLFSGALAKTHLNRVVLDDGDKPVGEERLLGDLDERIRDVIEDENGWLYLSTDSGRILRIQPHS